MNLKVSATMNACIGNNIKSIRVSRNISRSLLAKAIGVNESTVTRYENGQIAITLEVALRVSKTLNVNIMALVQNN